MAWGEGFRKIKSMHALAASVLRKLQMSPDPPTTAPPHALRVHRHGGTSLPPLHHCETTTPSLIGITVTEMQWTRNDF